MRASIRPVCWTSADSALFIPIVASDVGMLVAIAMVHCHREASKMQIGSVSQAQAMYSSGISAAARNASGALPGGRMLPPSQTSVSISSAAQTMLVADRQSSTGTEGDLPVGVKRMLERMVDDPAYGAEMAEGYAGNTHTACMTLPEFLHAEGTLKAGQKQLQAAWQDIRSEEMAPAQGYAELLRYELSMPQSYWDAMDPGHTVPDIRKLAETKLAYLETCIAGKV